MQIFERDETVLVLSRDDADQLFLDLLKIPREVRGPKLCDLGLFLDNENRRKRVELNETS